MRIDDIDFLSIGKIFRASRLIGTIDEKLEKMEKLEDKISTCGELGELKKLKDKIYDCGELGELKKLKDKIYDCGAKNFAEVYMDLRDSILKRKTDLRKRRERIIENYFPWTYVATAVESVLDVAKGMNLSALNSRFSQSNYQKD